LQNSGIDHHEDGAKELAKNIPVDVYGEEVWKKDVRCAELTKICDGS
jgi:hypothetical protein